MGLTSATVACYTTDLEPGKQNFPLSRGVCGPGNQLEGAARPEVQVRMQDPQSSQRQLSWPRVHQRHK